MLRSLISNNKNTSYSTLSTFLKVLATSSLGLYLGSTLAIHGSNYLDTAGLFHYEPEDEEEKDGDDDFNNDINDSQNLTKKNKTNELNHVNYSSSGSHFILKKNVLDTWSMESTGDLTLSTTINLHTWDPDLRAFQLLQYRSFLMNLEQQKPEQSKKEEFREWQRLKNFVTDSIDDLETRLAAHKN